MKTIYRAYLTSQLPAGAVTLFEYSTDNLGLAEALLEAAKEQFYPGGVWNYIFDEAGEGTGFLMGEEYRAVCRVESKEQA